MKKIILVHRWGGNSESDWYQSVKKELETYNFEVIIPEMPNTEMPIIEDWVNYLSKMAKLHKSNIFIGHSIGCQTILRFLEKENIQESRLFFIAPWFNLENLEDEETRAIANPWISYPINFAKVKENIRYLESFFSSNEPYRCVKENLTILKEKLESKVSTLTNQGHFTEEDGKRNFPELVDAIKRNMVEN